MITFADHVVGRYTCQCFDGMVPVDHGSRGIDCPGGVHELHHSNQGFIGLGCAFPDSYPVSPLHKQHNESGD